MKLFTIKHAALFAALLAGGAANAATYHYTDHWADIHRPALGAAEFDARLQADAATCDGMVGPARGVPTAAYRSCMLRQGWRYLSVTRVRVPDAPSDPNFSSNAKVAPGHYIDHDNGMDCQNFGGAAVCGPPSGTVRYYDPEQGLNCTRSGLVSICSNM
jgi:hypothetical protein